MALERGIVKIMQKPLVFQRFWPPGARPDASWGSVGSTWGSLGPRWRPVAPSGRVVWALLLHLGGFIGRQGELGSDMERFGCHFGGPEGGAVFGTGSRRSAARGGGWPLENYQNTFQDTNLHSDTPLPCGHGGGYVETSTTTDILGGLKGLRTAPAWRGRMFRGRGGIRGF